MVEKNKRSLELVHQEYTQLCSRAGHAQYQIHILTKDLELLNEQLRDLNLEAATIQADKPAEEAKLAETVASDPVASEPAKETASE